MDKLQHAITVTPPVLGKIVPVSVTATSAYIDLSAAANLGDNVKVGGFVTVKATADCYVAFSAATGATISAAGSTSTQGMFLAGGTKEDFWLYGGSYILYHVTASGTAKLQVWKSSADTARDFRDNVIT